MKHICENCGNEHDGTYGSGRFCGKSCRMEFIGKKSYEKRKTNGTFISGFEYAKLHGKGPRRATYGRWKCQLCDLIFNTRRELQNHNHNIHNGFRGRGGWNKGLTKEIDSRIANISIKTSNTLKSKFDTGELKQHEWSQQQREEASLRAKERSLGGYHRHGGRGKRGWYKGIWCDSSWELAWVIFNIEHDIQFVRCKERFSYEYKGRIRTYNPDFLLFDGTYIEIKGWTCKKWYAKLEQFPKEKRLVVIGKKEIQPFLKYVVDKYGKDFVRLYESTI